MAVADAWPFQQAIYTAVSGAVAAESVEVFDHIPTNPPEEFVRIDGLDIGDASWKDTERGRHSVVLMAFTRPTSGSSQNVGQSRVQYLLGLVHAAVKDLRYGRGRMNFEYMDVDPSEDGVTMQGMLRYTIHI